MRKARHKGHCQVCGRLHRLPGGSVAKHGYTVEHKGFGGFFNGVCWGSDAAPYEVDCGLVKHSIDQAYIEIARLQDKIDTLLAPVEPGTTTAPMRVYFDYRDGRAGRKGGYMWTYVEITARQIAEDITVFDYTVPANPLNPDAKTKPQRLHSVNADTIEGVVQIQRAKYAETFANQITHLRGYIEQQQERVDTWTPQPLTIKA